MYVNGDLTIRGILKGDVWVGYVANNKATASGGGVFIGAGTALIEDTFVYLNEANTPDPLGMGLASTALGGGVFVGNQVATATINRTKINNNLSTGTGGGVHIQDGGEGNGASVTLDHCPIYGNKARSMGAGVAVMKGTLNVVSSNIHHNDVEGNTTGWGGGVYVGERVTAASFFNSTIAANSAVTSGGGVWIEVPATGINPAITLDNTWVVGNTAAEQGGGIAVAWAEAGGSVALVLKGNTLIAHNTLTGIGSAGGGLYLGRGSLTLDGATFDTNEADWGDGVFAATGTQWFMGPGGVSYIDDIWYDE